MDSQRSGDLNPGYEVEAKLTKRMGRNKYCALEDNKLLGTLKLKCVCFMAEIKYRGQSRGCRYQAIVPFAFPRFPHTQYKIKFAGICS